MALAPGAKLGPYEIIEMIGAGGMGDVYRARDPRLRRDVAIKMLQGTATGEGWERFQHEARSASALSHPNICAIFDVGESAGQPYLVMELIEGETLRARIQRGALETSAAVAIALQIVDGLEGAHAKGIIHRDIKAGNIMLTGRQHAKILDFGLAKQLALAEAGESITRQSLTAMGTVSGTPQYLSPEVLQGATADARGDLWAFGVVLFQMLTGQLPFQGTTVLDISSSILKDVVPPLPAGVPQPLRAIVSRCLEKQPERRYQSAGELRAAIEDVQSQTSRTRPASRRRWLWIAAAAIVATAGGVLWSQFSKTTGQTVSTGGPASTNQEANELFELAITFTRLQNNIPKGLETLERTLAVDPNFSEARRAHAFYLVIHLFNGYTSDASQLYRAEEELRQVEKEAPDLVTLPASQTAVYLALGKKELIPVAKLDEQLRTTKGIEAAIFRGLLHLLNDQNREARALFEGILKTQPNVGPPRQLIGDALRGEGDLEGAIRQQRRVLELAPDNISAISGLSTAYLDQGNPAAARVLLEEKRPMFKDNYMWRLSWALLLAVEGKHEDARRAMDEGTLQWADTIFWGTAPTADFYALLGENSKAMDWLQKAVRNGDERIKYFQRNPRLAPLRSDPRFQSLIRSVEARRAKGQ